MTHVTIDETGCGHVWCDCTHVDDDGTVTHPVVELFDVPPMYCTIIEREAS